MRRQTTRQNLIDAAYALFQEKGFDSVTVDEIAQTAGVSRRTFFRYFPSKEKVVFPFNDDRVNLFREVIRARTGGRPASFEDLKAVFTDVVQGWLDSKERMLASRRIVTQSSVLLAYDHQVNVRWERAIALEMDGAQYTPGEEPPVPSLRSRMAAGMLVGAMRPAFEYWYENNAEIDLVAKGIEALELVEEGIVTYLARHPVPAAS